MGVGETPYTRGSGMSDLGLQLLAARRAVEDAGIEYGDIDGVIAPFNGARHEDLAINLGLRDLRYAVTSHMGGASAVAALGSAAAAIAAGLASCILVPTGLNGYSNIHPRGKPRPYQGGSAIHTAMRNHYGPYGLTAAPNIYGVIAMRYVREFGITPRQTGAVAVAMRRHAQLNPRAQMCGRPMSMDDYLASPPVSEPFRRFDCSLETDGGAAVVVAAAERARDARQRRVFVMGVAEGRPYPVDEFANRTDFTTTGLSDAAPRALAMAGVTPRDIDFAQLYDSFTFNVLRDLEEAGFCGRGEAGAFVEGGRIELGGELPVNTHGGLLSEGHVLGMNHVVEAVRQLRGTEGARQVRDAEVGMVVGMGGGWGSASLAILRR